MVSISARYSALGAPAAVEDLEKRLYDVLRRYYDVKSMRFDEIDPYEVAKHQVYHLSKALSKIQRAIDSPRAENLATLRAEVAPDMVIYALECCMAFETDWWRPLLGEANAPLEDLLGFLARNQSQGPYDPYVVLRDAMSAAVHATARLGELCDKHDHGETAEVDVRNEVVLPFMHVAFSLTNFLAFDLDKQFGLRLIDVANKYIGKFGHVPSGRQGEAPEGRHIAIASSSKFYDRVRSAVETFQSRGLTCHTPAFDFDETKVIVGREQKYQLTWSFLEKVRVSDVLYVIDTEGYTGTSVSLEVGYAYALGKPIYAIEPPSEPAVASLVTAVLGVDELAESLRTDQETPETEN